MKQIERWAGAHRYFTDLEASVASITPRKTASGIVHHARVRIQGAPPQSSVHKRRTDAVRWAQSVEAAIRERRFFPAAATHRHSVADAIDRYVHELPLRKLRDERNRRRQLAWWRGELGSVPLAELTAAHISERRDQLLRGSVFPNTRAPKQPLRRRQPATVNRYLAALSHVLMTAKQEWGWLTHSPMENVRKPKEPQGRARFLSEVELGRLLSACRESSSTVLETVVTLALATGMRQGEILGLLWSEVDFEHNQLTLTRTKNGERRTVPLASHACRRLQVHRLRQSSDTGLVFPGHDSTRPIEIRKAWTTALTRADLLDFRFHDLRHTAASYLAMQGCSALEIADVLGHKTLQMVKRYVHLSNSHTRRSLERLGNTMFRDPVPNT